MKISILWPNFVIYYISLVAKSLTVDYNSYGVINLYDNLGRLQSFKKIDSNMDFVYNVYNKDLVTKVGIKNNQNTFDEYNYEYQFINGNPVVNKIIYQEQTKNEFVYDEFGRLTKEIRGNVEDNYSYDIRGNIVSKNGVTYYYESSFMYRVTKIGNDAITYDVIGNISSYKGVNYSYLGKKLTSVTSDDLNISFVYNDANQRIKKINNSTGEVTYYVYENDLLKFEYTGNNWISYLYLDGKVVGFRKNGGSPYYYIYDGIGNIVSIMNSNNERVVNYEYDAFGNVLSITGPENSSLGVPNHFRYKGYYYDTETNLYFLKTRYYSPELCRFISPDSVDYLDPGSINGLNLYAYCGNDPINIFDPDGHMPKWLKWVIGGALLAGSIALTFATGGAAAGTVAVTVHTIASGAMIGGITNAIIGAVAGGISYENGTASWDWDGAADGFMSGSITGIISGAAGSALGDVGSGLSNFGKLGKLGYAGIQGLINGSIAGGLTATQGMITGDFSLESIGISSLFGFVGGAIGVTKFGEGFRNVLVGIGLGIGESSIGEIIEFLKSIKKTRTAYVRIVY